MKITTYAWLAGACLLVLCVAELVGVLSFLDLTGVMILAATGLLFSWQGGMQKDHCRRVVGVIGTLCLLAGILISTVILLSEGSVTDYDGAGEALFAVALGMLSILAAIGLPEPAEPSRGTTDA